MLRRQILQTAKPAFFEIYPTLCRNRVSNAPRPHFVARRALGLRKIPFPFRASIAACLLQGALRKTCRVSHPHSTTVFSRYLRDPNYGSYNINLSVAIQDEEMEEPFVISRTNFRCVFTAEGPTEVAGCRQNFACRACSCSFVQMRPLRSSQKFCYNMRFFWHPANMQIHVLDHRAAVNSPHCDRCEKKQSTSPAVGPVALRPSSHRVCNDVDVVGLMPRRLQHAPW